MVTFGCLAKEAVRQLGNGDHHLACPPDECALDCVLYVAGNAGAELEGSPNGRRGMPSRQAPKNFVAPGAIYLDRDSIGRFPAISWAVRVTLDCPAISAATR